MSQTIRLLIEEPKKDQLEKQNTKQGQTSIGCSRTQVLNTTHETGKEISQNYIEWYNLNKFKQMPNITEVRRTNVDDPKKVPRIGYKYPELRPQRLHPDDQELDHQVEDESPDSLTTRNESTPPGDDDNTEPPNPNGSEWPRRITY